jgi:tRNA(His) 5'-end guanylyltransferase
LILHEIIENDCNNVVLMNFSRYIIVHDENKQDALFFEFSQILIHRENYARRDSIITTIINTFACSTFIQKDQLFSDSII